MAKQKSNKNKATDRKVYSEFGATEATARPEPDLPPNQQNIRVQISRKGRKGKSVTIASGFVHNAKTLATLAKSLKASCGSGGTVKEDTIEIQGEHAPKLLSLLIEKGYQAKISGG
ncbi:MAG: translation initiation factor [Cyanobacteria bacterium P01_D01_bin.1]